MSDKAASTYTTPFWAGVNPIFVRCLRARMRPREALAWGAIAVVIAGFIFTMVLVAGTRTGGTKELARAAIVPLLAMQSFILLLLGTGSCATGMALERDVGILDFHRMTPMTPTAKILGFLFGLPAREYYMFLLTMPFMLAAVGMAGLSFLRLAELYVVFGSGVVLYHLTGLAAGMVTKRARRASWLAQATVLILYFVLPQFGHVGFSSFSYLTYMPTLKALLAEEAGGSSIVQELQRAFGLAAQSDVPFFTLALRPSLYSLFIQGIASVTFFLIVRRKLREELVPAFSKRYGVGLFAAMLVLLLGSVWPYWMGDAQSRLAMLGGGIGKPFQAEAALMVLVILSVIVGTFILSVVTPSSASFLRGLRRAPKRKWVTVPRTEDEASSFWVALALGGLAAAAYLVLAGAALTAGRAFALGVGWLEVLVPALAIMVVLAEAQGARAYLQGRAFLLYVFGLWLVPLMLMSIIVAGAGYSTFAGLVGGLSPLWTLQAAIHPLFQSTSGSEPRATWEVVIGALVLHVVLLAFLQVRARALAAKLAEEARPHRG